MELQRILWRKMWRLPVGFGTFKLETMTITTQGRLTVSSSEPNQIADKPAIVWIGMAGNPWRCTGWKKKKKGGGGGGRRESDKPVGDSAITDGSVPQPKSKVRPPKWIMSHDAFMVSSH